LLGGLLHQGVGSRLNDSLRLRNELLLSDGSDRLLESLLLHLYLKLLDVCFLALIQDGLLVPPRHAGHIFLHYPLVQGDLSQGGRVRLRMRLGRLHTRVIPLPFILVTAGWTQHGQEIVPFHIRRVVNSTSIISLVDGPPRGDRHVRVV
jgi:hypothetical protein